MVVMAASLYGHQWVPVSMDTMAVSLGGQNVWLLEKQELSENHTRETTAEYHRLHLVPNGPKEQPRKLKVVSEGHRCFID